MKIKKEELILEITNAFKDVKLGNGIWLQEGNTIDDYADDKTIAECKKIDERKNWKNISSESLNKYNSALSFFDAEAMRFHLPAFMIADIKWEYIIWNIIFYLTDLHSLDSYSLKKMVLLNKKQKLSVAHYLQWIKETEYSNDNENIDISMSFWLDV